MKIDCYFRGSGRRSLENLNSHGTFKKSVDRNFKSWYDLLYICDNRNNDILLIFCLIRNLQFKMKMHRLKFRDKSIAATLTNTILIAKISKSRSIYDRFQVITICLCAGNDIMPVSPLGGIVGQSLM